MKKTIFIKNGVHYYDSMQNVYSFFIEGFPVGDVDIFSKMDYTFRYVIKDDITKIFFPTDDSIFFTVDEPILLDALDDGYETVWVGKVSSEESVTDQTILETLQYYGTKIDGTTFDLRSNLPIDLNNTSVFMLFNIVKLGTSNLYYMVLNSKMVLLTDINDDNVPVNLTYHYIQIEREEEVLKNALFARKFTNVQAINKNMILLVDDTNSFIVDLFNEVLAEAIGGVRADFDLSMTVETNMNYDVLEPLKIMFDTITKANNYIKITIDASRIFDFAIDQEKLVFEYMVLKN